MQKYDCNRAIISFKSRYGLKTDYEHFQNIISCKHSIEERLIIGDKRDSPMIKEYQKKIKRHRAAARSLRNEQYTFDVFVKQYKQKISIEYTFQHVPLGPMYQEGFKHMIKEVINTAISQCRERIKLQVNFSNFAGYSSPFYGKKKNGRVFAKEGEILNIYVQKNLKSLYTDKQPTEPKKYVGIEIEFCAPIKENELAIKLFQNGIHKFAQLKKDQSLRPQLEKNEVGYELAVLLEENNYKKRLKQLIILLNKIGAITQDRRAGLHVHIDMRRRNKELVYNNLVACQYALLSVVDPKRINNEFCRVIESRKFPTEFTGQREERYKTINAAAFYKYKTLEVRMHEGSVDYKQISNWIDLLIRVADYPKKMKSNITTISTLGKRISLNKKVLEYVQDKSCFWQVRNERSESPSYISDGSGRPLSTLLQRMEQQVGIISREESGRPRQGITSDISSHPMRFDSVSVNSPVWGSDLLTEQEISDTMSLRDFGVIRREE